MARYNVPIPGYGSLQQEWGQGLASIIDIDRIEALILGFNPVVSSDYQRDLRENRLGLSLLIGTALTNLNFNVAGYTAAFYGIARDFHLNNFQKVALVEAVTYYASRKARYDRVRQLRNILEIRVPVLQYPYSLPYFADFADKFGQALPTRLAERVATRTAKSVRMYKKTGDKKYLTQIKTTLHRNSLYSRVLQDMTAERFPYLSDDIYLSMAGSNLWAEHQWNSIAPKDTNCILPTGEIVRVGAPFTNGLISPPAHGNCYCYLTPIGVLV